MMGDLASGSAFARAYKEAEERKAAAEAEAEQRRREELAAAVEEHVYDPLPYPEAEPHDAAMYAGTGIGALYGLPECERFLPELGDWTLNPRSTR